MASFPQQRETRKESPVIRLAIAFIALSMFQFSRSPDFNRFLSTASALYVEIAPKVIPETNYTATLTKARNANCEVKDASLLPDQIQWFGSILEDLLTTQCSMTLEEVQRMFRDPPAFGSWVRSLPSDSVEYQQILRSVEDAEYSVDLVRFLNRARLSHSQMRFESSSYRSRPHAPRILIAVTAAPQLIERVRAIARTYGDESQLPPNALLRYYFGHDEANATVLAERAGIVDVSSIVIMPGIDDVEYPNTKKGAAVFRHMHALSENLKERSNGRVNIDWFFDGDDDTYVNVPNMIRFVADKDPTRPQYIGRPCVGSSKDLDKLQLDVQYCNGGPGFLVTQIILRALAEDHPEFLTTADDANVATHEDVRVGMFVHRRFRIGCAGTRNWEFRFGKMRLSSDLDKMKDAAAIATHDYKIPGEMEAKHKMLQDFYSEQEVNLRPRNYHEEGLRVP